MSMMLLVAITTIKYTANINAKTHLMKFLTWLFAFQHMQPLMEILLPLYCNAALKHLLPT